MYIHTYEYRLIETLSNQIYDNYMRSWITIRNPNSGNKCLLNRLANLQIVLYDLFKTSCRLNKFWYGSVFSVWSERYAMQTCGNLVFFIIYRQQHCNTVFNVCVCVCKAGEKVAPFFSCPPAYVWLCKTV